MSGESAAGQFLTTKNTKNTNENKIVSSRMSRGASLRDDIDRGLASVLVVFFVVQNTYAPAFSANFQAASPSAGTRADMAAA